MAELTAEVDLTNVDGLAERVKQDLSDEEPLMVEVPHDIIDPFDAKFAKLEAYLRDEGVVSSEELTEIDIRLRKSGAWVIVTHSKGDE